MSARPAANEGEGPPCAPPKASSGATRLLGALAAVLVLSGGKAAGRSGADGDEWLDLDRELSELRGALGSEHAALRVGVTMKYRYRFSNDLVYTLDPKTFMPQGDLSGFEFQTLSLRVKGELGAIDYKLGYNPAKDRLRSTFVRVRPFDWVRITLGRFKAPLLRSRLVSTTKLLFPERTLQARVTGPRDEGVKVEVYLGDRVTWFGAIQNGSDGVRRQRYAVTRLEWRALGGGAKSQEGALGAGERGRLTLGVGIADDSSLADGRVLAADMAFTLDRFSLSGEVLRNGDDFGNYDKGLIDPVSVLRRGDTRPWEATVGWLLLRDTLELATRWEALDDDNDTERLTLGVDWYREGHKAKWQASWSKVFSDNDLLESDVLSLGFVLGF